MFAPTIALATGEGLSSATAEDGRTFNTPFAQSVVLVLANGEWKYFTLTDHFLGKKRRRRAPISIRGNPGCPMRK
jgi:hypothetical protein